MQRKSWISPQWLASSSLWQDPAYGMDHQMNSSAFGGPELLVRRAHPSSLSSKNLSSFGPEEQDEPGVMLNQRTGTSHSLPWEENCRYL